MSAPSNDRIVVVGLGYVGLPLAVALARSFDVIGLDVDARPGRAAEARDRPHPRGRGGGAARHRR